MDHPRYPNSDADPATDVSGGLHHNVRTSRRWVSVAAIIAAIALVTLLAGLHLTGVLGPGAQ